MSEPIYSPGLEGVIAGETGISTITGGLSYRGYSIEDLASHASFEETAFLILQGELPNAQQLANFRERLGTNAKVEPEILATLRSLPRGASMMDALRTATSMLAAWDPETADNGHEANVRKAERLLAKLPVVMCARYRLEQGQEPIAPDATRSLADNLLWMLNGRGPTQRAVRAMDISLTLYAEHEFNASTFTARVVASTLSDLHSCITAAIGALKGPLHGGANEKVLDVLTEVGSPARAEAWVRDALARKVKIMGFGHRVYKDGDPRAEYLKPLCRELATETGHMDLEDIAAVIERIVRGEKRLPPNLDWPSARLYHYLGLPVQLYTPLFVLSRVVGWSAHVIEQHDNNRIIRPRSRYNGPTSRPWVEVKAR